MIRLSMTFFAVLLTISLSDGYAETYTWTDEQGTVHFTEDLGAVPKNIRKNVRRVGDVESSPDEKPVAPPSSAKAPDAEPQVTPSSGNGGPGGVEIYAGKTYGQWKQDLAEREAAMEAVRKRLDEIAAQVSNPASRRDNPDKLMAEQKTLVEQFNEMKAQYNRQVEIARKAGLQINLQQ